MKKAILTLGAGLAAALTVKAPARSTRAGVFAVPENRQAARPDQNCGG